MYIHELAAEDAEEGSPSMSFRASLYFVVHQVRRRFQMGMEETKTLLPWAEAHLSSKGYHFPGLVKYPLAGLVGLTSLLLLVELALLQIVADLSVYMIDESLVLLAAIGGVLTRAWTRTRWIIVKLLVDIPSVEGIMTCIVCAESMQTHWVLACGHAFCSVCLAGWFDATYDRFQDARQDPEVARILTEPPFTCPYCRSAVRAPPAPCYTLKAIMDEVGRFKGLYNGPDQAMVYDWSRFWPQEQATVVDEEMAELENLVELEDLEELEDLVEPEEMEGLEGVEGLVDDRYEEVQDGPGGY
ncbi:hypothetical protein PM082_024869 [Marasmius tenuissimus]|nr:hypothetical protein PM082_024869 [Marasmius tenuissimus]